MKKILLILLVVCVSAAGISFYKNTNTNRQVRRYENTDLEHARALRYRMYLFGVIPVGDAIFHTPVADEYNGTPVYRFSVQALSSRALAALYSADIDIDSYIDREEGVPLLFRQHLRVSNKKDEVREVIYDQENLTMQVEGEERKIFPRTHDPLSAIFALRRMSPEDARSIELSINTNQKNYVLRGSGTFQAGDAAGVMTVAAGVARRGKSPYHKSRIEMVLLRRKENVPVMIKVFASGFLMYARLVDTE